jgi:hypothetical protein
MHSDPSDPSDPSDLSDLSDLSDPERHRGVWVDGQSQRRACIRKNVGKPRKFSYYAGFKLFGVLRLVGAFFLHPRWSLR